MEAPLETSPVLSDTASGSAKWHPKLTPYRVLVLGTTISVGTTKAILSLNGQSIASTTLEWIFGVVICLTFQIMSTYDDSPKDPPPVIKWLFHVDCADYVWRVLSFLYIHRPQYSSDPESTSQNSHRGGTSSQTPVTLYRLLVCITTTSFGLTKATLAYYGYSTAANWVDWTLGVLVTSGLYIVGLYESSPVGTWHGFFGLDYGTPIANGAAVLTVAFFFVSYVVSCAWVVFMIGTDLDKTPISWNFLLIGDRGGQLSQLRSLQDGLLRACLVLFMVPIFLFSALCLLFGIAIMVDESRIASWHTAWRWVWRHAPWRDRVFGFHRRMSFNWRVAGHIVIHLIFLTGCGIYLAFWIISIACTVKDAAWLLAHRITVKTMGFMVVIIGVALVELLCAAASMYLIWLAALYSFLDPILLCWNGDGDWAQSMIF